MNVLLLSEHYTPKLAGTVSYAKHLMEALAKVQDLKLYFLCPSEGKVGVVKEQVESYITFLKVGVRQGGSPAYSPQERKILVNYVKSQFPTLIDQYQINIVHLLYGFFLAETIDTKLLKKKGVRSVFTVHNIPPEECSTSWSTDNTFRYLKDEIRKLGVKWVNQKRLKCQNFDVYLTPSAYVKEHLKCVLPKAYIQVTPHGGAELIDGTVKNSNKRNKPLNLLTVGGIVPHKQQALIPAIVAYLKEQGVEVNWRIVGPFRNLHYARFIKNQIETLRVEEQVSLLGSVSENDLHSLYVEADAYVQLSKEEGFCMTVLDAIAYGIPVMATPVGAIPEMLECVGGILLDPDPMQIRELIKHYLKILPSIKPQESFLAQFKAEYKWDKTAEKVLETYRK